MPTTTTPLRVLIVDDNRDGADALGLLVEALGNQVHVTYGGTQALDVATAFRPDLLFVDLVMPGMDGCDLVKRFRQMSGFAHTTVVAITGLKDDEYKDLAKQAGCDAVLVKPAALAEIKTVIASVAPQTMTAVPSPRPIKPRVSLGAERRLPMVDARRIRNERLSKTLTQPECEAAISDGIIRFQEEYLGWRTEQVLVHFIKDLLVVRIHGALTLAERQLVKASSPDKGRDLIKQARKQLLELARPMLESLIHEATGVKVSSMHHDISTATGEEVIIFSLVESPRFE
ncbi:MAG: Na-translocating system protein MpsC family protein [Planctomycetaceae bacterium]